MPKTRSKGEGAKSFRFLQASAALFLEAKNSSRFTLTWFTFRIDALFCGCMKMTDLLKQHGGHVMGGLKFSGKEPRHVRTAIVLGWKQVSFFKQLKLSIHWNIVDDSLALRYI